MKMVEILNLTGLSWTIYQEGLAKIKTSQKITIENNE